MSAPEVEDLRILASLLRGGLPLRDALAGWAEAAPASVLPLEDLRRSLRLGLPAEAAVRGLGNGPVASILSTIVTLHRSLGGDAAALVDRLAGTVAEADASSAEARAAAAGARLSAHLIGGVPLLFLPLSVLAAARGFIGWPVVVLGIALAAAGLLWIDRLVPDALEPGGDEIAQVADLLAAALEGGAPPGEALRAVSECASGRLRGPLRTARRETELGVPWTGALERSPHEGLRRLALPLRRSGASGERLAAHLRAEAAVWRGAGRRAFEERVKRAPVLMVLPLSFCVLPAFVLLGLVPLLRLTYPAG